MKIPPLIIFLYLLLFFLTPFLFSPISSELFELPKMYFVYALTTLIVTTHLINYFRGKVNLFRYTPLTIPLVLFLVSQIISTYFSIDVHTSIFGYYSRFNGGLLSTICYLLLYFVLVNYLTDRFKNQIINISLLSGLFIAGYGILEHFGIDKHFWVQDVQARVFSTLGQPNWLAAYLGILLPFALSQFFHYLNQKKYLLSSFNFGLLTVFYLCLLFTKSKSGIIAAIIPLAIFSVIYLFKNIKNKTNLLLLTFNFGLLTIFSLTITNPIKDYLFPSQSPSQSTLPNPTLNITSSVDIRQIVWQGSLELWRKFPLVGTGVETFAYSYYWTRPVSHNLTSEWDFLYNKAHNEYLNFLATTGTFGLLTYLLFLFSSIYFLLKNNQPALLASFVSIIISNFFGFSVVITSLYLFLLPALISPNTTSSVSPPKSKFYSLIILIICIFTIQKIINSFRADVFYNLATSYENGDYYQEALAPIKKSLALVPEQPIYLVRFASIASKNAIVANKNNQSVLAKSLADQSIKSITKALIISPANINFYKEQAQIYYYLSSLDTLYYPLAIESIIKATKLAPTDAKSFYILGQFWQTIDKTDQAITAYTTALDLKPNYDHASFALAQLYYQKKDFIKSKPLLELTLKLAPNNLEAKNLLDKIR